MKTEAGAEDGDDAKKAENAENAENVAKKRGVRTWLARLQVNGKAVLALGGVLLGLGGLGYSSGHTRLWIANGLDLAVVVEIDGTRHAVEPASKTSVWLSTGVHRARVLGSDDRVLDEHAFSIVASGSNALHVYNVLGSAPVYVETIQYTSSKSNQTSPERGFELFAGVRFASKDQVDYVFETPPSSLSMEQRSSYVLRTHADLAPRGWQSAVSFLVVNGSYELAASVARDVSRAQPEDLTAAGVAAQLTENVGSRGAAMKLARAWRDAHPEIGDGHRMYQTTALRLGRSAEVVEEYTRWYAASEKTAEQASLFARVLLPKEARVVVDEALARHPDAPDLLLRKGLIATFEGDHAEADALFTKAQGSADYRYFVERHARALVALGRGSEAARRVADVLEKTNELPLATTYAQIAQLPGVTPPAPTWTYVDRLAAEQGGAWRASWARSVLGETAGASKPVAIKDTDVAIAQVHFRAAESPAEAWTACSKVPPRSLADIDATVAILLAAEVARAGDLELAEKLLAARRELSSPWRLLVDYVTTGAEAPELGRLDPQYRAALDFARARALQAAGQPAEVMLAAAARGDVMKGVVTRAMAAWAKPTPPGAPTAAASTTADAKGTPGDPAKK